MRSCHVAQRLLSLRHFLEGQSLFSALASGTKPLQDIRRVGPIYTAATAAPELNYYGVVIRAPQAGLPDRNLTIRIDVSRRGGIHALIVPRHASCVRLRSSDPP